MAIEAEAPNSPKEKAKALDGAIKALQAQLDDKGIVNRLGSREIVKVDTIPTGIVSIDYGVLGIGGFPRGRIVEVYGPQASGKTTICLQVVASAQKAGGQAAYVDAEHALDPTYARTLGVDVDNLILSQPDCGEQALQIVEGLISTNALDVLVVDSVAALTPRAELEGEMGDAHMGLQARLMGQACRKLLGLVRKTNVCLIMVNQLRMRLGITYGSPETTPGGMALPYAASIRLDVRRVQQIKKGEEIIGGKTKFKAAKNKLASPFKEEFVDIYYGEGFDAAGSLIDMAVQYGVLEKSGAWLNYNGEKLGNGRDNVRKLLREDVELKEKILAEVMKHVVPTES